MRCRNCGQDNPPKAGFCGNCGTELAAEVEKPSPEAVPSPSQIPRKWRLIGGIAMLIVIGVVIGLTLLSDGSGTTLQTTTPMLTKTTPLTAAPLSEGSQVGNLAPNFQLQGLDGETISLSDLRGYLVMLNFWATWCGPCRSEMPYLQQIYDEWQDTDLVLLTINKRESPSEASSFIQDNGYSFPVLLDTNNDVSQDYNITGIPTTFFIDREGIIQEVRIGSFPSKEAIEDYLSKIISPTATPTTTPISTTTFSPLQTTTTPLSSLVPILLSPANGAVLDNGRTDFTDEIIWDFDWLDVTGATQYHLYVVYPGKNPVINNSNITTSSYHHVRIAYIIESFRYGWTWKVRAMIDNQWGEWSEVGTFDVEPVNTDPPTEIETTPLSTSTVADVQPDTQAVCRGLKAPYWRVRG